MGSSGGLGGGGGGGGGCCCAGGAVVGSEEVEPAEQEEECMLQPELLEVQMAQEEPERQRVAVVLSAAKSGAEFEPLGQWPEGPAVVMGAGRMEPPRVGQQVLLGPERGHQSFVQWSEEDQLILPEQE
jgi:hypothetical protein